MTISFEYIKAPDRIPNELARLEKKRSSLLFNTEEFARSAGEKTMRLPHGKVTAKVNFEVVAKGPAVPQPANGIPFEIPDDGFKELMRRCVQEVVEIVKEVNTISWQNEDMGSIALTLFIQRMRV